LGELPKYTSMISNTPRYIALKFLALLAGSLIYSSTTPSYSQVLIDKLGASFPLLNDQNFAAWIQSGNANWHPLDPNGIAAEQGAGLLTGRLAFTDFQLQFSYWVDDSTTFSIFAHCTNPSYIASDTALEINLANKQIKKYGVGSVVGLIQSNSSPLVKNQWNTVIITSIASQLTVTINGINTIYKANYSNFQNGPFAIKYGGGDLKIANLTATIPGRW